MNNLNFTISKKLTLLFVGILSLSISLSAQKKVQILLLGGQSNMEGHALYADLSNTDKAQIDHISNRIKVVSQNGKALALSYSANHKHIKEFGPELFIGLTLAKKYPHKKFLFIKTAMGGTSLHGAWSPNWTKAKALASEYGSERQKVKLYNEHITAIHKNLNRLKKEGQAYNIMGMVWMQGEKDTRLKISASNYKDNLKTLINAYRKEFNLHKMPFIFGQVNNPARHKDYKNGIYDVRNAMAKVNKEVKYTYMLHTSTNTSWSDYPKREDNVHYNAEGQKRIGIALAKALITFQ